MVERDERVTLRTSSWELQLIDRAAEAAGETRSEFVRSAALDRAASLLDEPATPTKEPVG